MVPRAETVTAWPGIIDIPLSGTFLVAEKQKSPKFLQISSPRGVSLKVRSVVPSSRSLAQYVLTRDTLIDTGQA